MAIYYVACNSCGRECLCPNNTECMECGSVDIVVSDEVKDDFDSTLPDTKNDEEYWSDSDHHLYTEYE